MSDKKDNVPISIVLVGPMPIEDDIIGGTKVLFKNLVDILSSIKKFHISVINTSRPKINKNIIHSYFLDLKFLFRTIIAIWVHLKTYHIVFWNVSPGAALSAGPLIWFICKIRRRPLIIRFFGGDLNTRFESLSKLRQYIVKKTILKADLLLLETQSLVDFFKNMGNVHWFPTTRDMPIRTSTLPKKCRNFVFIGQLRQEKGLKEIVEASKQFPKDVSVAVYGPPLPNTRFIEIENDSISYMGVLHPDEVPFVLQNFDMLLFPSYYQGEGYPGIVIEALQLGVPVIATKWNALPEIIEDGESGLLIEPQSSTALVNAIYKVVYNDELYQSLVNGARERGEAFRSSIVATKIENWISELCKAYE